ncbi:DUF6491 family protein [Sandarakinorhabdus sp.]|uniref:DUF6491 family protein n=1 Tax=Sandarakinorhabdus sp. TaxID=1916663 RepID=UPI0033412A21
MWGAILVAAALAAALPGTAHGQAQPAPAKPAAPPGFDSQKWRRMPVRPGGALDPGAAPRPAPPRGGHHRCIAVVSVAGAQFFGDGAIELTMKSGQRWRMHLAQECPALSFYQGFYYQQQRAGLLCAGRDAIGARSGGECGIAAIVPVRRKARQR